ncbi:HNH endonuclease [Streptomyces barringtoniae]|uniref:HNH endonuclease n=1 Tax=Streptomyces barringtoniae TaxID=2892029 RepID=UPI001E376699|nr:HNH endonuclease signature motif containing protein [Streptomyces barringtoniae]MCC5479056.1 HNH endonuclease [Streptomyces barringtoniae]
MRDAQTMDHLLPSADGGADDISNLVPACYDCNSRKQGRNPVNWYLGVMMKGNWSGDGSLRAGGGSQDLSLRDLSLTAHTAVLGWLDHLDTVTAEVNDADRISWFIDRYYGLGWPSGQTFNGPSMYAVLREQLRQRW